MEIPEIAIDSLGRCAATRRFLVMLLLTIRFHLISRSISSANDLFFYKLSQYSDIILNALRSGAWELLNQEIENGISELDLLTEFSSVPDAQEDMAANLGRVSRRYFRPLYLPWSSLPPADDLTLNDWQDPDHVLFAVGPNIGIGDEMILFRAAQQLAKKYPDARFQVSSFNSTLWDACDFVDEIRYELQNPMSNYAWAKTILENHPQALIVFAEFNAAPLYRQLEQVPGFQRFLYLDTSARLVRLVDASRPAILEYLSQETNSIYRLLDELLLRIGIDLEPLDKYQSGRVPAPSKKGTVPHSKRVFLNPFSSKDLSSCSPDWWARALNTAGSRELIEVVIFCGVNEWTRLYALKIVHALDPACCVHSFYGEQEVPSIQDTLQQAMACDAVFGIDTFTGHLSLLKKVPSLTVFVNALWHFWKVPLPHVLNVSIYDGPEQVGTLLTCLLWKQADTRFIQIALQLNSKASWLREVVAHLDIYQLRGELLNCRRLARKLCEIDQNLYGLFTDLSPMALSSLENALASFPQGAKISGSLGNLLNNAWNQWIDCNFSRYLRFVTA